MPRCEPGVEERPAGRVGVTTRAARFRARPGGDTPARTPSAGGRARVDREAAHLAVLSKGQTRARRRERLAGGIGLLRGSPRRPTRPRPTPWRRAPRPREWRGFRVGDAQLRDALRINDARAFPYEKTRDEGGARRRRGQEKSPGRAARDGLRTHSSGEYLLEVPERPRRRRTTRATAAMKWRRTCGGYPRARGGTKARRGDAALRRRSAAIRRDLPRPPPGSRGPATEAAHSELNAAAGRHSGFTTAAALIAAERVNLAHDLGTRREARRRAPRRRSPTCRASRRARWRCAAAPSRRRSRRCRPRWGTRTSLQRRSRRR